MKINKKMLDLISELTKNAKKSDRDIAKKLKISQPTVTRMRKKLEDKGYITNYTTILDLSKLGFEIVAFIFFKAEKTGGKKVAISAHQLISQYSNIIYAGLGNGLRGQNCLIVSLHKNFTDYTRFLEEIKKSWSKRVCDWDTFLVTMKAFSPKPLSFGGVGELIKEIKESEK